MELPLQLPAGLLTVPHVRLWSLDGEGKGEGDGSEKYWTQLRLSQESSYSHRTRTKGRQGRQGRPERATTSRPQRQATSAVLARAQNVKSALELQLKTKLAADTGLSTTGRADTKAAAMPCLVTGVHAARTRTSDPNARRPLINRLPSALPPRPHPHPRARPRPRPRPRLCAVCIMHVGPAQRRRADRAATALLDPV